MYSVKQSNKHALPMSGTKAGEIEPIPDPVVVDVSS
jgi:hypothetical protein